MQSTASSKKRRSSHSRIERRTKPSASIYRYSAASRLDVRAGQNSHDRQHNRNGPWPGKCIDRTVADRGNWAAIDRRREQGNFFENGDDTRAGGGTAQHRAGNSVQNSGRKKTDPGAADAVPNERCRRTAARSPNRTGSLRPQREPSAVKRDTRIC